MCASPKGGVIEPNVLWKSVNRFDTLYVDAGIVGEEEGNAEAGKGML